MDEIPGTSFAVEDAVLAPEEARQEISNDKDPVDLIEATTVAPNIYGASTN